MNPLFVVVACAVLASLVALHWYVWRRMVRDTTRPGSPVRRVATALFVLGPVLFVGAFATGRLGLPFLVKQIVAWPGYLWAAVFLYLLLALLAGELVRPLLLRMRAPGERGREAGPATPAEPADSAEPSAPVDSTGTGTGTGAGTATGTATGGCAVAEPATATAPAAPAPPAPPAGTLPPGDPDPKPRPTPSRRLFVSRIVGGTAAAVALGTVGAGTYGVLRGPRLKHVTVPLAKLPRAAHGYRIAVVSDVHLGPILGRGHTQRIVDTVNSAQPDLIAVVGDLVDGSVAELGHAAEPLAQLRARDGSYFVTGNHEYFSGAAEWVDHVRELGLRPLENARVEKAGFDLAGVNDVAGESYGQGPDFVRALGDRDRSRASVLLAHQPIVIDEAVEHGVDLQLSGHTHGGQLWPGNLIAGLANPTVEGLERYGDTQLYVSRGAGAWGPPVRVGAPSDITIVQLAAKRS
ncbi:metallophosphoesterase [Streptomyces sp. CHA1]|uniref:metallophosphoesterase n=1 Tax=Streptomyces TaxID=1883 RepID=UPI00053ED8EF|nr:MULTISPECIES: metallophosphoesterase [unclassified Streptomyces]MBP3079493.1 membrane protein [Streptomyces sp. 604F]MBT3156170.1 metallophosphoesterase [Streptomyces sp. G11C]MCO6708873.1 metallophosphoesterase [Streptomyces sp. CHA3]MCO6714666.1 metallophosphoesterase [Streptomyces sp. CHB19.2]MCO6726801.1 metallophosphoesterase [Streptomyces sp. CHA16]